MAWIPFVPPLLVVGSVPVLGRDWWRVGMGGLVGTLLWVVVGLLDALGECT